MLHRSITSGYIIFILLIYIADRNIYILPMIDYLVSILVIYLINSYETMKEYIKKSCNILMPLCLYLTRVVKSIARLQVY